jgi:hypothetical protein
MTVPGHTQVIYASNDTMFEVLNSINFKQNIHRLIYDHGQIDHIGAKPSQIRTERHHGGGVELTQFKSV